MPRAASLFLILALGLPARSAENKPRLAVMIVVDQMRADYMPRFADHGFGRFLAEGAYYDRAMHGHIPTYTAVGHAALSTGRFPKDHGIMGNEFFDRASGKTVTSVEDAEHGIAPLRLDAPTLGDAMKAADAKSKVVAIAGKDRAAVMLAGRKADLVLWYDKDTGRFTTSGFYGALPAWVEAFNDEHQVPEKRRKSIREHPHWDHLTLALARRAAAVLDLGADESPDLLLVGLSVTDYLGHRVGPFDPLMDDNLKRLDREIGSFLDFLDFKVGAAAFTAALSSDHGVLPIPESPEGKAMGARRISSADARAAVETGLAAEFGKPAAGESWILGWNPPQVNLNIDGLKRSERRKITIRAAALLAAREEFAWAYPARGIPGSAAYAAAHQNSLPKEKAGDIVFLTHYGVLLTDYPDGTSHGSPYDYDARVPLGLLGAGIKPGRFDREALTVELAPTLGRLLGVKFKGAYLKEALVQ